MKIKGIELELRNDNGVILYWQQQRIHKYKLLYYPLYHSNGVIISDGPMIGIPAIMNGNTKSLEYPSPTLGKVLLFALPSFIKTKQISFVEYKVVKRIGILLIQPAPIKAQRRIRTSLKEFSVPCITIMLSKHHQKRIYTLLVSFSSPTNFLFQS